MDAASPARRSALAGRSYSGAVSAAWLSAAWLLAIVHLAAIAFLVVGGVLALRRPILVWAHVVVVAAVATIFLTGRDCPLTVMQKACLRRSGRIPYAAGFVEHCLVRPIAGHAGGGAGTAVIIACWVVPTVTSYSVRAAMVASGRTDLRADPPRKADGAVRAVAPPPRRPVGETPTRA
jgi:hypothetical protein